MAKRTPVLRSQIWMIFGGFWWFLIEIPNDLSNKKNALFFQNLQIFDDNHQWFMEAKNLQISLVSGRNPQWFPQAIFWIFVRISSISGRNHHWFLQETKHTFFRISRFFPRITNDSWRQKKQKIFKFRWFLSEIPNDLSRNVFPFSFRFHRFRAEITNDFCNQKTHIFSEFLDFGPKSPMIYVGEKKILFCFFSEFLDFLKKSPLISAGKKKSRKFTVFTV